MENYFYKCNKCGFVHLIPAYWVGFSPDSDYEMPHIDTNTGQMCENILLSLVEEND